MAAGNISAMTEKSASSWIKEDFIAGAIYHFWIEGIEKWVKIYIQTLHSTYIGDINERKNSSIWKTSIGNCE